MAAMYLNCRQCGSRVRAEVIEPRTTINNRFFCPCCGSPTNWSQDLGQDYWYTLAEAFDLSPCKESADLIQSMYDTWTEEGRTPPSFRRYVEELREEASADVPA
jgi:hypothetical protein